MKNARFPSRAMLFAGIMYAGDEALETALRELASKFGAVEASSNPFDFTFTDYYSPEMGAKLKKKFVLFGSPVERDELAEIKSFTSVIEAKFSDGGKRKVNIDPGYITPAGVILATTKDSGHRIYLREGIFAEATLTFKKNDCVFFDWTYPDFRTPLACDFFLKARRMLLQGASASRQSLKKAYHKPVSANMLILLKALHRRGSWR